MEPPVGVSVLEQAVVVLVVHPHLLVFFFLRTHEVVGIDEVIAGVVGRVYVPTDFDTKEKALSGAKAAEKGLK